MGNTIAIAKNDSEPQERGKKVLDNTHKEWMAGLNHGRVTELVDYYAKLEKPVYVDRKTISRAKNSGFATERVRRLINDFLGLENDLYL